MPDKPIASISRTRQILRQYDLRPKKGYGQNFLVDVSVVARTAEASHCEGAVIEVGPGIGSLTEQLALRSRHVTAYEIDERLKPVLEDTLSPYDNVEVLFQDFLSADLHQKVQELQQAWGRVVFAANLPYYLTSAILFRIFAEGEDLSYLTVMVQKEVAQRFSARPGSADYSALSVESQALYDITGLFTVPPGAFAPSPKVDSAVVQFHRRPGTSADAGFDQLVRGCFAQRRKTIYNNLRSVLQDGEKAEAVLQVCGIAPDRRPQQLQVEEFLRLYEEVSRL